MLQRYLIVWLTLLSGLAFVWTDWFSSSFDPFTASKPYWDLLFGMTMFAIGWMLPRDEIRQVARRWPTVLAGTAIQYSVMPLLAFAVAALWQLPEEYRRGLMLVGCVPGAMASNVLTLAARGNVSYSVSLTVSATLLSPLVVPWTLYLALGESTSMSPLEVSVRLWWTVVFPVLAGHLAGRCLPRLETIAGRIGPLVANLTILWIIAGVVAANRDRLVPDAALLTALLTVNGLGYLAGQLGGRLLRLTPGMTRALTLEIGMQNAGLGTVLAARLFPDEPQAMIPCALYTFGCMLTGTLLVRLWLLRERTAEEPPIEPSG